MRRTKPKVRIGHWKTRPGKLVVNWRDLAGTRHVREFTDDEDGEHDAEKFKVSVVDQLRSGVDGPNDRMSFGSLGDSWLQAIKDTIRRPTYKYYSSVMRTHLKPAFQSRPAVYIRPKDLMDLAGSMLDKEKGSGLAKGTVAGMIAVVRAMFRWGKLTQYVAHDPSEGVIKALRLGRRPKMRRPLTGEEVGRFMKAAEKVAPGYMLHFHTLFETGCRLGECFGIMDVDVDPENLTVSIRQQVYEDGTLPTPKSERGIRTVRVSGEYMALILKTYADRKAAGTISPWLLHPEFALPHPTSRQSIRARRLLHAAFKAVASEANLPSTLSPHWIRHTHASDRLAHGEDLARLSQALGHSRMSTTLDMYVEAMPKPQSTAADEAAARRKRAAETADMTKVSKFAVRRMQVFP